MDDEEPFNFEKEYREAVYVVFENGERIFFRVGKLSVELNALLVGRSAASFAFITASNPYSRILPDKENEAREIELKDFLRNEKSEFLEGYGTSEREVWQKEKSCLIFDIPLEKAVAIGRNFEQNAILHWEKNKEIELVWCFED